DAVSPIAAARQEARQLFELAQVLGTSLSLDETLSALALRVQQMCPCDAIAIYIRREDHLESEYRSGQDSHIFGSLRFPLGHGLSGWVAENRPPVVNGNPREEASADGAAATSLQSAMAVPLEGLQGLVGVLSVYSRERKAFTNEHLRILSAVTAKVASSIENA